MTDPSRLTGIPIEVLFSIIGALIIAFGTLLAWIGSRMTEALTRLQGESARRGNQVSAIHTILGVICGKLGIDYHPPDP